jgi:hypothetical protein
MMLKVENMPPVIRVEEVEKIKKITPQSQVFQGKKKVINFQVHRIQCIAHFISGGRRKNS